MLGETWGQSIIPWGHCWFGDQKAKEDPRGGFQTVEEYLRAYSRAMEELVTLRSTHGYNAVVMTQVHGAEAGESVIMRSLLDNGCRG